MKHPTYPWSLLVHLMLDFVEKGTPHSQAVANKILAWKWLCQCNFQKCSHISVRQEQLYFFPIHVHLTHCVPALSPALQFLRHTQLFPTSSLSSAISSAVRSPYSYEYVSLSFQNNLSFKPQLKYSVLERTTVHNSFIQFFICLLLVCLSRNDKNSTRSTIVSILFIIPDT